MIQITLKPGKEESLLRFHPWVFSGAIRHMDGSPFEGETVKVVSSKNQFLGIGHYQIGSITVRIISFVDIELDEQFWQNRLLNAYSLRKELRLAGSDTNNIYRLVHGEGDGLPGLIIDIYGKTAVMQSHSAGMYLQRQLIIKALHEIMGSELNSVYDKSESTVPFKANLNAKNGYLTKGPEDHLFYEYGNKFQIDWILGQKTGFFIDQRENRKLVETYAHGKNVLNVFCYTGGFSVYALRGGALHVDSIDSSEKAIELTNRNVEMNFTSAPHRAICTDAFDFLNNIEEKYDMIILDPPAFAKHQSALTNALQAYKRINNRAISKIRPGGILFTFSCSQAVSKDQFRQAVFSGAAIAKRNVRILQQLTQPQDHPINIYHPEGEYLKGLVLYIE